MKHFPIICFWITLSIYAGLGIWLALLLAGLLKTFGIEQNTPAMLTEIRAFYGGVELGIAGLMLLFWRQGLLGQALLLGGIPLLGTVLGRMAGLLCDGFSSLHLTLGTFEAAGFISCFAGYRICRRAKDPSTDFDAGKEN
ncbi:MAG: hypothetical protein AAF483_06595 [Planctomycetota bacterium]